MNIRLINKILFTCLLLLILVTSKAQISTNQGLEVLGNVPTDTRDTLTTLGDTSNVVWVYPGLLSYAVDQDQFWYHNGSYWSLFAQGGGLDNMYLSNDTLYSVTTDSTYSIFLPYIDSLLLADSTTTLRSLISAAGSQYIDTLVLQGDTLLKASISGDGIPALEINLSPLKDNLGNHIMTQNLQTNGNWISGDGGNEGLYVDGSGNVGIGTLTPSEKLHIPAKIKVNNGIIDMTSSDTYIGTSAGSSQVTPNYNLFLGHSAGTNANSFYNTFLGANAGRFNTGNRSTFIGAFAGEQSTAGESVFIGSTAGRYSSAGSSVLIGSEAGDNSSGSNSIIVGFRAGRVNAGGQNIFIGTRAGQNNTGGFNNVLVGYQAGPALTTGPNNTLIGSGNGTLLSTGSANTIIGSSNGVKITTHNFNTIIGTLSGFNFKGSSNLLLGYQALVNDTLSNSSVVIGNGAAQNSYNTTSSIFLGNSAGPSSNTSISSKLYIANSSGSPTIYGDLATKNIGIGQETADYVLDMGLRTGAIRLPVGTTAQRPTGANGLIRYNSDLSKFEGYYNAQWNGLSTLAGSGTSSYIPKWTAGNTIGNSMLYINDNNLVGVFNNRGFIRNITSVAGNVGIFDKFQESGIDKWQYAYLASTFNAPLYGQPGAFRIYNYATNTPTLLLTTDDKVGLATGTPTARLHLPAGTATANTAPLKFTSGTNLTTPEAGAMEWDGTNLYITQTTGPTRKTIAYTDDITAEANDLSSVVTWANVPDANITQSSVLQHQGALTIDNIPSRKIPIGTGTGIISATGFQLTTEGTLEWYSSTGADNTGAGGGALRFLNGTSTSNSAFGVQSMGTGIKNNTDLNSSFGAYSLSNITEGDFNTSLGAGSGLTLTTGSGNFFGGFYAGNKITDGSGNILLGTEAGANDATYNPDNMIAIGNRAAYNVDAANSESIFIGAESGSNEATYSDLILIGSQASATQSNQIVIGHEKTGFESTQLKSRNYRWNIDQTLGASQDGYVMTYNNTSGELELQAGSVSDGNGIFDVANDDGTIPATFEARLTDILYFSDSSGSEFMTLNGTTQQVGIGTIPSTGYGLSVGKSITATSGIVGDLALGSALSAPSTSSVTFNGLVSAPSISGTNNFTGDISAALLYPYNTSSGTISNLFGLKITPITIAGTITNMKSLHIQPNRIISGTVTNVTNIELGLTGSGYTNYYGLRLLNTAAATNAQGLTLEMSSGANKYNIYASGTANSYFAGDIGINDSSPDYDLDVDGTFGVSGTVRFEGYGSGLKEAADLSKTRSGYIATYATDGTLLEEEFTNPYGGESSLAGILDSLYAGQSGTEDHLMIPDATGALSQRVGGVNDFYSVKVDQEETVSSWIEFNYAQGSQASLSVGSSDMPFNLNNEASGVKLYGSGIIEFGGKDNSGQAYGKTYMWPSRIYQQNHVEHGKIRIDSVSRNSVYVPGITRWVHNRFDPLNVPMPDSSVLVANYTVERRAGGNTNTYFDYIWKEAEADVRYRWGYDRTHGTTEHQKLYQNNPTFEIALHQNFVRIDGVKNTIDSSGVETPINFLYTDETGKVLSGKINNSGIYYVSTGGNNTTASPGNILTNYADPWSAIDSAYILTTDPVRISIAPGTYTFSGTYLADNTTSLLQPTNSTPVSIYGPDATISYNSSPYTTGFISDMNAAWTSSAAPIDLTLDVKELSMLSTSASVACPILVTNPNSKVSGKIGVIRSATSFGTTNRNWGIEVGANYVDLEVDTIWYDGDLAVSFWRSYDASGIVDNMKERNMKVAVDYIYVASQRSAIGGVFRVQPGLPGSGPHTDSLSTYEYNIGTVDVSSTTTHKSLIDFGAQSSVDIIYGNTYTGSVKKVNNASFDQVFGIAMGASDTSRASTYNYNVEVITGLDGRLFGPSATSGVFDNIDLNININKSDFQDGGEIEFGTISVFNSRININCNDCKSSNADALIKFNFTSSGGNKIIVSGNWWNNSSAPVIDVSGLATTDTLILQNVQLRNDGSVAAVNSTTSRTVYVQGAYDWNNITNDADVTFSRLDEYGSTSAFAEMYINLINPDTISFAAATDSLITETTAGLLDNFTHSNGRLTYTGAVSITVSVNASTSFTYDDEGTIGFLVYKNGTYQEKSRAEYTIVAGEGNASKARPVSTNCLLELSTNDYIEVGFEINTAGSTMMTVEDLNVIITKIK